jgi:hypothetical protein
MLHHHCTTLFALQRSSRGSTKASTALPHSLERKAEPYLRFAHGVPHASWMTPSILQLMRDDMQLTD